MTSSIDACLARTQELWALIQPVAPSGTGPGFATVLAGVDPAAATDAAPPPVARGASWPRGLDAWEQIFTAAEARHGLPPGLLRAVAAVESGGDPAAVSPAGARGLMQLMPATAKFLGVDPMDPPAAIDGAARLLKGHLQELGSIELALAAYNAGGGAVRRHGGIPPYPETQRYVQKVLDLLAAPPPAHAVSTPGATAAPSPLSEATTPDVGQLKALVAARDPDAHLVVMKALPAPEAVVGLAPMGTTASPEPSTPASSATSAPDATSVPSQPAAAESASLARTSAAQVASAVRGLRERGDGVWQVEVRLDPAELGTVHVSLEVRGTEVSLRLHAGSEAGAGALRSGLADLRSDLAAGGLDARSLDVSTGTGGGREGAEPQRRPAGGTDARIAPDPLPDAVPDLSPRELDLRL